MTELERVLMNRDDVTAKEAARQKAEVSDMIYEALADGAGYDEIEDILSGELGLEMDYIFDLI